MGGGLLPLLPRSQIWRYRGEKAEIFGVKEAEVSTSLIKTDGDTRSQERGMGGAIDISVGAQNSWLRSCLKDSGEPEAFRAGEQHSQI